MGWAWRCTNGMVLFISYIYHIVFGDGCECVRYTEHVYLHALNEASVGRMLAVGRVDCVTASEVCYAKL